MYGFFTRNSMVTHRSRDQLCFVFELCVTPQRLPLGPRPGESRGPARECSVSRKLLKVENQAEKIMAFNEMMRWNTLYKKQVYLIM